MNNINNNFINLLNGEEFMNKNSGEERIDNGGERKGQ